ncbi:snurportin-1 [Tanacetum coccineum]
MAPPHDTRRPHKRPNISDQHKRRELSLQRQANNRTQAQLHARRLASSILSEPNVPEPIVEEPDASEDINDIDLRQAAKLKGPEARRWFASQLMLPEWMIDVPDRLNHDWYVFARPSGKRCFVVSSNGTTVSRLRNGSLLHRFPSALPNGAKTRDRSAQSYCILDCIFHELDQTYYVIDMVVLELQDNGQLVTSDDPPVVLGCLNAAFIQEAGLHSGNLVRFAINDGGLTFVDGKLEKADLQYIGKVPRGRAFADSYSKYIVLTSPLRIEHLVCIMGSLSEQDS